MWLEDLFGRGGSHNQGTPTTTGAGDGAKGNRITDWLTRITGAYEAVTGAGTRGGPAPAPQASQPKTNPALYIGLAVAGALLLFLLLRKR